MLRSPCQKNWCAEIVRLWLLPEHHCLDKHIKNQDLRRMISLSEELVLVRLWLLPEHAKAHQKPKTVIFILLSEVLPEHPTGAPIDFGIRQMDLCTSTFHYQWSINTPLSFYACLDDINMSTIAIILDYLFDFSADHCQ
jgi:hypothetical protein